MKISIAQIDSVIGDFSGNAKKIVSFTKRAKKEQHADMVLFPELVLSGYPPMDLLDQDSFVEMNLRALDMLKRELPADIAVGVGYVGRNPLPEGKALVNAYGVLLDGRLAFEQHKILLPTYDVFDEARYFESGRTSSVFEWKGERIGFAVCEDMWRETDIPGNSYTRDPVEDLLARGISLLCVPSASPYFAGKFDIRLGLAEGISRRGNIPVVYINAVGANDSIIFDGRSFVLSGLSSGAGESGPLLSAASFSEDLVCWDSGMAPADPPGAPEPGAKEAPERNGSKERREPREKTDAGLSMAELDTLEDALVLGIRDYMGKCGFASIILGLSGGIDSALVAYLAVRAAGPERVRCFGMPSRFSSRGSQDDAVELARNLGCALDMLPIEPVYGALLSLLEPVFAGRPFDLAEENLQARIRGTLLMGVSNKFGSMLLTTGNKSELAMGYCTLYGDMCGALAPLGDLFKTEVFALCRRINERGRAEAGRAPIPETILTKPPSAELRPNQTDQDSLPPYEVLDEILRLYLFENLSGEEIAERGHDGELADRIIRTVARAEFKRRQAPPVLKVSPRAFGLGRRMPIARHIHEI